MEMRNVDERNALAIRTTTPVEKISDVMSEAYQAIAEFMGKNGIPFAGPPFAVYHNMDMSALDLEMGFPIAVPAQGNDRIRPSSLPSGRTAVELYTGPYAGIAAAYDRLKSFVAEQGESTEDWCYEFYLNSPLDTPEEKLQTEIHFPLKG